MEFRLPNLSLEDGKSFKYTDIVQLSIVHLVK